MRTVILTTAAKDALNAITAYIAESSGSRRTARNFVARLKARCIKIASLPQIMGRSRAELGAGMRSITEDKYLIFFRYVENRMEIIGFVEGHRDVDSLFRAGDEPADS